MMDNDRNIEAAALEDTERGIHVPSLPLELWLLIFSQNTDPKHLWITGRQVCSTWRSKIPKVIAKKYLECPQMTQIHASCTSAKEKHLACMMGHQSCFSHYESKTRAVFKHSPLKLDRHYSQECRDQITSAKETGSRSIGFFQLGRPTGPLSGETCLEEAGGRRCDIPPYQIWIKWDKTDTELPCLEVDFEKREISFEWQRMLELFYGEIEVLDRRDRKLAKEATEWLDQEKPDFTAVLHRAVADLDSRRDHHRKVRRNRIDKQYREIHGQNRCGFTNTANERMLELRLLRRFHNVRCAEDEEQKQMKKDQEEAMHHLHRIDHISKRPLHFPPPPGEEPLELMVLWERYIDEKGVEGGSALEALRARHWLGRHRA
jgi:hypothetical protein